MTETVSTGVEPFYSAMLIHPAPADAEASVMFSVIREISAEDHKRFRDAYNEIDDLLNRNVFTYFKSTLKTLVETMEKDAEELLSGQVSYTQPDDAVRMGIRMRSAVLAFCSALHFHQEHNYKEVVRRFGENSRQHKRIQRVFNRLFEKSPAYRILYHTRNTMVHHAMDIITINFSAFLDADRNHQAVSAPRVDVEAIADLNTEISESFRNELRAYDERPLVLELAAEAAPLVMEANERILGYLHSDLDSACRIVCEFDAIFEGADGTRCLTHERSTNPPPPLRFGHATLAANVILYARKRVSDGRGA
ncbi:hypothetical protein GS506_12890 [Rhodococcus hoagii]|nr:hypothetical protein [Prescottella equi]